jgi:mannosyltransferase OCH1-like enzyme
MIPRKIHYCWFGQGARSPLILKCMESWKRMMPEYEIKEWNESNSPMEVACVKDAHRKKLWSKVSNYVRLAALSQEGGIYLDTDVEVLKSFDPLLGHSSFLGFQQEREHTDWLNNAVFGSVAGHPFLENCMDATLEAYEEGKTFSRAPVITTDVLRRMGLKKYGRQSLGGVEIYPLEYFYPFPWWGSYHPDCVKEVTYCVHHWEISWKRQRLWNHLTKLKWRVLDPVFLYFSNRQRME